MISTTSTISALAADSVVIINPPCNMDKVLLLRSSRANFSASLNNSTFQSNSDQAESIFINLAAVLTVFFCLIGLVGNFFNLVILTRRSLLTTMDRMEKSAHTGLVALALSDFLFCASVLPDKFTEKPLRARKLVFQFYAYYAPAIANVFVLSSTWLTVCTALSRYVAICHPLKGRQLLGMTFARATIVAVFTISVCFNTPRFLMTERIQLTNCSEGYTVYRPLRPFIDHPRARKAFEWSYFVVGILLPLLVLVHCNTYLIKALRASAKLRREHTRSSDRSSSSKHTVNKTLMILVFFYIFLVVPAELLHFADYFVHDFEDPRWQAMNVFIELLSAMEVANFSLNFVLYCVVSVYFRRTVAKSVSCFLKKGGVGRGPSTIPTTNLNASAYESVPTTTMIYHDQQNVGGSTKTGAMMMTKM